MVSKKELPIGYSSNFISAAKENLRKDALQQKLIKRRQNRGKENKQETNFVKANPRSLYKIPYFYKTGKAKIISGEDLPERIVPVNAEETERISFLSRLKSKFFKQD